MKLLKGLILSVLLASPALAASKSVDELNSVLRGELSAIETYNQVLEKFGREPQASTLRAFLEDHQATATDLKDHITKLGGQPSTDSGAWGEWAKAVTGTAKLFGDAIALTALKKGEEHGLKEHQDLIANAGVPIELKDKEKKVYIPRMEARVASLDQLIDKAS